MTYNLEFLPSALKEWHKLDNSIIKPLKKKLKERLQNPSVEKDRLSGYKNVYKIKLGEVGYRLAYEVKDNEITVLVLCIGKRGNNEVYEILKNRINYQ